MECDVTANLEDVGGRTLPAEERVSAGGFVLVSGCLCLDPAVMSNVSVAEVRNQTTQVLKQMEVLLMQAGTALTQKSQQKAAEPSAQPVGQQITERRPHMETRTGQVTAEDGRYRCRALGCGKAYKNRDNLQKHNARVHDKTAKLYACNQLKLTGEPCDFSSLDAGKMSNHKKYSLSHNRREDFKFACPACRSRFPRRHELDRHVRACKSVALNVDNSANHLPSSGGMGDILLNAVQVNMPTTSGGSIGEMHVGIHAHGNALMLTDHSNHSTPLVDSSHMALSLDGVNHDPQDLENTSS